MILRMSAAHAATPLLDAEHAAFIQQPGISITAASRAVGNRPVLGRALGCRVAPERSRVAVFVSGDQNPALVSALRESRAIAVVFSQPSTHRTIQLKGTDARVEAAGPRDREGARRWTEGFVAELAGMGYTASLVETFLWCDPEGLVSVSFTPCAAFQQTPGPGAGAPLAP
jgi:hypothetical protein